MEALPHFNDAKFSRLSGLRLFLAADLHRIGEYRRHAQEFLQRHLVPSRLTDDLVLVIDEAMTNVVRHSYEGQVNHTLQLQLFIEAEEGDRQTHLTIILVDRGEAGRHYSPA
ncbi:MAG: ATP-binding protein, partial [Candidatus Sericytochromatia bacterium]